MLDGLVVVDPFAAVLNPSERIAAVRAPLWVPWPLPESWSFAGLAHTPGTVEHRSASTVTCWTGADPFGDPAEILLVSDEAGSTVGSHFAGLTTAYPGGSIGEGPPHARFECDGRPVPVWSVDGCSDRAVYAGEAAGRWLWVVVHPAEASAIVVQPLSFVDARALGAEFATVPVVELSPRLVIEPSD